MDRTEIGLLGVVVLLLLILLRMPMLIVGALLDLLSLRQVPVLRVRSRIFQGLLRYYAGVIRTGSWLSPRALANQTPK